MWLVVGILGKDLKKIDVGSSVPPESPSMNLETGRFSATNSSKLMKIAENQNGITLPSIRYLRHLYIVPLTH